jgi:DNA-binding response OmpR family regulator
MHNPAVSQSRNRATAERVDVRLTYGPLTIDLGGSTVSVAGRDVPVTATEFMLLTEFARHPNRVLRHDELVAGLGHTAGCEELAEQRRIRTHVARLRRKLQAAGCDCLSTVRRVGYRFEPASTRAAGPAGPITNR